MCGIFAYVGNSGSERAYDCVFSGLKKLEYRGYDSWGIATLNNSNINVTKEIGKLQVQPTSPAGYCSVGHTRWATHGGVNRDNAHPHFSSEKDFVVVHNGIVENFEKLKKGLVQKGAKFSSETDTEVIVKLMEDEFHRTGDMRTAVRSAHMKLEGRNTIVVLTNKGLIIGARNGSPIVFGISPGGEDFYLSSDIYSFADKVDSVFVLDNNQMLLIENKRYQLVDIKKNDNVPLTTEKLDFKGKKASLGKFKHYMEKEIADTPGSLLELIKISNSKYLELAAIVKKSRNVYIVGSGTAGNAASQMAFNLRKISDINAISLIGSDCSEFYGLFNDKDLIIALSQSGETADVIEVLERAKKKGVKIASFVNMPGSMITRLSDIKFMANAGPEICVMSTKVFTSQIVWGYIVAKTAAGFVEEAKRKVRLTATAIDAVLRNRSWVSNIKKISRALSTKKDIYILGKAGDTSIAKEGMVKIIEGSYIHAHAIPAGDLKHYAITMIEKGTDVLSIVPADELRKDVMSSVSQIKARGGTCMAISSENSPLFDNWIKVPNLKELSPVINIIPFQLIAYYLAVYLGNDVDKPRNIAKSVTVK
ncbi:MAG: Glucosamine/fructose-6-phosphate aminotransferase, isomerizing [candidate division WWE3 bacterium GW2011_GWB2_43_22]|uniref:Glutamine--fructose-6-phosphate aminotransferase [isomerizing] n=1 Tax=candidate division WWE3 bacterium GW2011_GWB2_43_22 TaxID=1619118 RepID=A0A0G1EN15_UNCKA|nr:MAG: Glucosamine/fructose-6-phosphate aminotransferase, isomerizing [candidate division WWE3 bacterium GW2011_GWB2_43_22]